MHRIIRHIAPLSFVLYGFFLTSCETSKPASEIVRETEPQTPVITWTEIPEDAISFVRMHPKAAQKNTYANWKHFQSADGKTAWRLQNRDLSEAAAKALDDLVSAANANLIPSDGFYTCRYTENMPEYRIEFKKDQKEYRIISISNGLNAAPFNIIIDGKHFIQITGELGTALDRALKESDIPLKVGETAGMILFDQPMETPPQGFDAAPSQPHNAWFDAAFRADSEFAQAIAPIESIAKLQPPEVACNQAKSADCSTLMARYQLKTPDDFDFTFSITSTSGKVSFTLPPAGAFESLAKALQSPVVAQWKDAAPRTEPVHLKWAESAECSMIKGLAKYFDAPENPSCASWTLTSKDFPTAVYYPGISALWVEPGRDLKPYFEAVTARFKENKKARPNFSKFSKPSDKRNLFIRLDGKTVSFMTDKDGKTTIE